MLHTLLAIVVSASIDSSTIYIGDQTDLHLQATCNKEEQVAFPHYGEQVIEGIEIVDRTIVDTTILADGRKQMNQYLTITSFKDSLFYIPAQAFVSGEDTIWSQEMSLNVVQPFEVDTTLAITDIKGIQKAPIWWWGIIRWILLAIGIIALGVGIYYLVKYLKKRNQKEEEAINEELLRPAEEVALEKLDIIKEEKIWQEGKVKQYHTELTQVIREYIGRRYAIQSTEKTSDETLRAIKPIMSEDKELYGRLEKMLRLADLVKFAKWEATAQENEQSLASAYEFVHQTTPVADSEAQETDSAKKEG